jgi:hypothetical protein
MDIVLSAVITTVVFSIAQINASNQIMQVHTLLQSGFLVWSALFFYPDTNYKI